MRHGTLLRRSLVIAATVAGVIGAVAAEPALATPVPKAVSVVDFAFTPTKVSPPLGGSVQWTFAAANFATHTASAATGLALWDSGFHSAGTTYTYASTVAGTFTYHCNIHTFMTATVGVTPRVAPTTGTTTTTFTVTWATGGFMALSTGATLHSMHYTPTAGPGTYRFRVLVRDPVSLATSTFSPAKAVTVS